MVEVSKDGLWCMHISGMDEFHAAPDRATAQLWAAQFTVFHHRRFPSPDANAPLMNYTAAEWPWSAEKHTAVLEHSVADNTWPVDPLVNTTLQAERDRYRVALEAVAAFAPKSAAGSKIEQVLQNEWNRAGEYAATIARTALSDTPTAQS